MKRSASSAQRFASPAPSRRAAAPARSPAEDDNLTPSQSQVAHPARENRCSRPAAKRSATSQAATRAIPDPRRSPRLNDQMRAKTRRSRTQQGAATGIDKRCRRVASPAALHESLVEPEPRVDVTAPKERAGSDAPD